MHAYCRLGRPRDPGYTTPVVARRYTVEMGSSEVRFAHAKATRRSPKTGFKVRVCMCVPGQNRMQHLLLTAMQVRKGDLVDVVEFQEHWALLK